MSTAGLRVAREAALVVGLVAFFVLGTLAVEVMVAALPAGADTGSTGWEIVTISVCTVLARTAVTTISVFKPWGPDPLGPAPISLDRGVTLPRPMTTDRLESPAQPPDLRRGSLLFARRCCSPDAAVPQTLLSPDAADRLHSRGRLHAVRQ